MNAVQRAPEEQMTLEAYLEWEAVSGTRHEFYNGKVLEMPGGTFAHSLIAANVMESLKNSLRGREKRYFVLGSDMKIYLPEFNHAVYPDAVVICEAPQFYKGRTDLLLNPLLIVEVLSEGTEKYDRGEKFLKYQTLPSFQEYVLISQTQPFVTTWYPEAPDLWRLGNYRGLEAKVVLRSLGIELPANEIFEGVSFENVM